MKYTVNWHRYKYGNESDPMIGDFKYFANKEDAIVFLEKKANRIRGIYWAGGYVEDSTGNTIYEILA